MNLKRFKHGEWITDYSELQTLRNNDILSNIATSKIFDVSIVDPLNRDEILAHRNLLLDYWSYLCSGRQLLVSYQEARARNVAAEH